MVKLPDSGLNRYDSRRATPNARLVDNSAQVRQVGAAAQGMLRDVGATATKVFEVEKERMDAAQLLEGEQAFREAEAAARKKLENDTDYDTHGTIYRAMTNDAIEKSVSGIWSESIRQKARARFQDAAFRGAESVDRNARQGKERQFHAKIFETEKQAFHEISDPNTSEEEVVNRIRSTAEGYESLVKRGWMDPVTGAKAQYEWRRKAAVAYADRIKVTDVEKVNNFDQYVDARKKNKIKSGASVTVAPKGYSFADRQRHHKNGGVTISLDTNWAAANEKNPRGRTNPVIVIPDDASPEQRAAAQRYVDGLSHIYRVQFGVDAKARVVTRSENGRGKRYTMHTEPFAVTDEQAVQWFTSPEGLRAHSELLKSTLGQLPGARFTLPHEGGSGAVGPHGSEGDFARQLATAMGQDLKESGDIQYTGPQTSDPKFAELDQIFRSTTVSELVDMQNKIHSRQGVAKKGQILQDKKTLEGALGKLKQDGKLSPEDQADVAGALSRATPAQQQQYDFDLQATAVYRRGLYAKAPDGRNVRISELSETDIALHRANLEKGFKKLPAKERSAAAAGLKMLDERIKEIEALRESDPAMAAETQFESVASARSEIEKELEALRAEQEDREINDPEAEGRMVEAERAREFALRQQIVEARQEAQRDMGLPEDEIRLVTKLEADRYLPTVDDDTEAKPLKNLIKEAMDKAFNDYGDREIAAKIVEDAYQLKVKSKTAKEQAKLIAKLSTEFYDEEAGARKFTSSDMQKWGLVIYQAGQYNPEAAAARETEERKPMMPESMADQVRKNPTDRKLMRYVVDTYRGGAQAYVNALMGLDVKEYQAAPPPTPSSSSRGQPGAPPEGMTEEKRAAAQQGISNTISDMRSRLNSDYFDKGN